MLVFGPYSAIPSDMDFDIYNLSSLTQAVPRLPGLMVTPFVGRYTSQEQFNENEKDFDMWYYDYVMNNYEPLSGLMMILDSLYHGHKVFVCISDYTADLSVSILNESLMKLLQVRYGMLYSVVNEVSDFECVPRDGCDFMTSDGVVTFKNDRSRFIKMQVEHAIDAGALEPGGQLWKNED